jgi:Uma2 family endonuclease
MTEAVATIDSIRTLADLVERLGGVPIDRIRIRPAPGTATVEDVERIHRLEGRLCELVDGVLVEKPMGYGESLVALYLGIVLGGFVKEHNLGLVAGADGIIRILPDIVRIPDISFVSWDRLPGRQRPKNRVPAIVPNLVIEIISDSNTISELRVKRSEYFAAGAELVWEIDPNQREVRAYTQDDQGILLPPEGNLDGSSIVPGFVLPLSELFAEIDRQG